MAAPPVIGSSDEEDIDETKEVKAEQSKNETIDKEEDDEEEMEDLFGEDEEDDQDIDANGGSESKENGDIDANHSSTDEEVEEEEEEEIQRAELTLPRHPRSHTPKDNEVMMFDLPRYLSVDPEPFSPASFQQQMSDYISSEKDRAKDMKAGKESSDKQLKDSIQFKKLQMLNTARWRYAKTASGELYKQSNAKIVEWEDGTMSLKLGNEYFEMRINKNEDNILAFQGGQVLVGTLNVNRSIRVLPPSTKSIAHKILASTIQNNMRLKKTRKINTIVTKVDPELKARENEKALREVEKARRRREAKEQQEEERLGRQDTGEARESVGDDDIEVGDEEDESYSPSKGKNADGYENDDFVVDDEEAEEGNKGEEEEEEEAQETENSEEEEERLNKGAERLQQLKKEGSEIYKRKRAASEAPSNGASKESIAEEDEEDQPDAAVVRKKRRVIADDDDE